MIVDVDDTVDEADEENNSTTVRVLRPTIPPTCPPSATPTRTDTPSPTLRRTPSATPTSCVSEPPNFYVPTPSSDNPFVWNVGGRSRVLLNGRGSVSASLNGQSLPVERSGSQDFAVVATFEPGSSNVLAFCTHPSACGTPCCAQEAIVCDDLGCEVAGVPTSVCPTPTGGH